MEKRILIKELKDHVGEIVQISGFVDIRRDHGKLIFIDLRDEGGKIQMVVLPSKELAHKAADTVRPEWVVSVMGLVKRRPEKMVKDGLNGDLEFEVESIEILNEALTPKFDLQGDGHDIGEDIRMKYRYLDLRRARLQKNIRLRHKIIRHIRDYLSERSFIEIETPILTKSTPEGARDYIVPSRLYRGKFYALPQSPQQYKQLLMVSGFEKYFQIARCFRDEDTRGDRQPEFTQLDMELAFVDREDVMSLNEALIVDIVKKIAPEKEIQELPFPRISYKKAMEEYGTDRPDIRKDKNNPNLLAFCWVVDFPFFEKTDDGNWTFTHNPFSRPRDEDMENLMKKENLAEILTTQYDVVLNGFEIGGGSIRNHKTAALRVVFEIIGHKSDDIDKNFGHMLEALSSGAPPHGGIAWGLDRFISLLAGEPNIREVIAFAKTGEGRDLLMDSPSDVSGAQLKELGIKIEN